MPQIDGHAAVAGLEHAKQRAALLLRIGLGLERRPERDDLPDQRVGALGQLTRIDAAQTPAQERDARAFLLGDLDHLFFQLAQPAIEVAVAGAGIGAHSPVVADKAGLVERAAQRHRAFGAAAEHRQNHHRLALALIEGGAILALDRRRATLKQRPKWVAQCVQHWRPGEAAGHETGMGQHRHSCADSGRLVAGDAKRRSTALFPEDAVTGRRTGTTVG